MSVCVYHEQAKDGFQFLYIYGRFSKIQSQFKNIIYSVSKVPWELNIGGSSLQVALLFLPSTDKTDPEQSHHYYSIYP